MSHLLSTLNPAAVDRIEGEGRPLPLVGEIVRYHPRAGEVRQGRTIVPAIVTKVDEPNRLLEVVVVHHSDDLVTQDRLAAHVDGDRGWSRMPGGDLARLEAAEAELALLKSMIESLTAAVVGDFEVPEGKSVLALIADMDDRVGSIEEAAVTPAPASAVKPGRANRRRAARG